MRRAAEEERRVQNERITQLEHMVQAQMQHNLKLQSMLDSQFAQVRLSPIVETVAMTMTAGTHASTEIPKFEFVPPTRKAAPAAPRRVLLDLLFQGHRLALLYLVLKLMKRMVLRLFIMIHHIESQFK